MKSCGNLAGGSSHYGLVVDWWLVRGEEESVGTKIKKSSNRHADTKKKRHSTSTTKKRASQRLLQLLHGPDESEGNAGPLPRRNQRNAIPHPLFLPSPVRPRPRPSASPNRNAKKSSSPSPAPTRRRLRHQVILRKRLPVLHPHRKKRRGPSRRFRQTRSKASMDIGQRCKD